MAIAVTIAERIQRLLLSLRQPSLAPFLAEWPQTHRHRVVVAGDLPVLRWLGTMACDSAAFGADLVTAVADAATSMAWRQTYTAKELGCAFIDNYGYSEIVGTNGPLVSERLACGFLILGPSTHYPRHHHEAQEIYIPLSGTAGWQQGAEEWRDCTPGTLIYHAVNEPHSMRTGASPLLALYLWRGAGLAQKARLG